MRYKEYNPNKVLEKVIPLFWQHGFHGCSVNDLVNATGVNRFSLYEEFENKEGILYKSLQFYRERYCDQKLNVLNETDDLDKVLKKFYLSFLSDSDSFMGCYFIHIGTELADTDERVKKLLDNYLKEVEQLFADLLIRNHIEKEQAKFNAQHLLALYCTVMSFCLIHTPKERERYIENGIQVILPQYA